MCSPTVRVAVGLIRNFLKGNLKPESLFLLQKQPGPKAPWRVDVAKVFIPTMLQPLTGGVKQTECAGRNVRQIIAALEEQYPGIMSRLVENGEIRSNLAVSIDGDVARMGMLERVSEGSEVHFVPAIAGG